MGAAAATMTKKLLHTHRFDSSTALATVVYLCESYTSGLKFSESTPIT